MRNPSTRPRRARRARHGARAARRGVSIVEMLVAIVVLAIGILGLASTAAMVARQMRGSTQLTVAGTMAQARFERLNGQACVASTGTATARGITERWGVTLGNNGTAYMYDTLSFVTRRGVVRKVGYQSMKDC